MQITQIKDLRLTIPFEDFNIKFESLKKKAEELHSQQIQNESEYSAFELVTSQWYVDAYTLFRESFNSQSNKFEYQFRVDFSQGTGSLNQPNFQLYHKVKTKKDWLLQAKLGLITQRNILSVCDLVLGVNGDETEKAKSYNFGQKMFLGLYLLNKLPAQQYYPIPELLMGNGVIFSEEAEQHQVFNGLVQQGFISGIRGTYGKLTIEGKLKVEEIIASTEQQNETEPQQKTTKTKTGRIFISQSHKDADVVKKFIDLILHIGLKIDPEKDIYCTSLEGSKPKTGEDFKDSIKVALESAPLVLQFISENYKKSEVCLNEMGAAWVLCDKVMPLNLDGYEVGFIHNTTQQVLLQSRQDLLRLTDELQELGICGNGIKTAKLSERIDEFLSFLKSK